MFKLKLPTDKIFLQRVALMAINGLIGCGIFYGYLGYNRKVSEYMQSLAHQRATGPGKDQRTGNGGHEFSADNHESYKKR